PPTHCSSPARLLYMRPPRRRPRSTLFPYTTLFRSFNITSRDAATGEENQIISKSVAIKILIIYSGTCTIINCTITIIVFAIAQRSEEHTSELQSRENLVCRLLLEKKKTTTTATRR